MTNEATVQDQVKLASAQAGARLWRNNSGAMKTETGFIRFGLASDIAKVRSADLIGITPVVVQQHHLGLTLGVFTAPEIKHSTWTYTGDKHEQEQLNFINIVRWSGGYAGFVRCVDDYFRMTGMKP